MKSLALAAVLIACRFMEARLKLKFRASRRFSSL
jgi:hypothetical protein